MRGLGASCFFFQAEDGIRDLTVTGVQTCALPISPAARGEGNEYEGWRPCLQPAGAVAWTPCLGASSWPSVFPLPCRRVTAAPRRPRPPPPPEPRPRRVPTTWHPTPPRPPPPWTRSSTV